MEDILRRLVVRRKKTTPDNDMYKSLPLTETDSFRLLTLLPSTKFASSIQCTLSVSNFNTASYQALSYCWGNAKDTGPVKVNHANFQATKNLIAALRRLRHETNDVIIWVDAICINQKDVNERNAQVQHMGSIYSQAMVVMCWLGEAKDESHLAFRMMKSWGDILIRHELDGYAEMLTGRYGKKSLDAVEEMSDPFNRRAWNAVMRFLERPWWFRVWMVQEFILGKDAILLCGQLRMSWRQLSAVLAAENPEVRNRIGLPAQLNKRAAVMYMQRLLYHASRREDFLLRDALTVALNDTAQRLSTDPRDRVYGIMGLMSTFGQSLMQVDYSLSMQEIYIVVARQSMLVSPHTEQDPILDLFYEAGTSNRAPGLMGKIPTWVPDWQKHAGEGIGVSPLPTSKYSATRGSCSVPRFSKGGLTLHVWGTVLDRVVSQSQRVQPSENESIRQLLDEVWILAGLLNTGEQYPTGTTRLEAFFRTTTCDMNAFLQRWDDDLITAHACLAMFCVEIAEARSKQQGEAGHASILEAVREEKGLPAVTGFGSVFSVTGIGFPPFPENYDFDQGLKMAARIRTTRGASWYTTNRRCFQTAESYMGLGPLDMKEGDLICALFGSNIPFILREDDDEYILIGEAYIHGFMDGEAMAQVEAGVLVPQEFAIK
jgi:hypothetical protein